jgi:hypothetical protein
VYTVGQRFQHRRDSSVIRGAAYDAAGVVTQLVGRMPVDVAVTSPESAA